VERFRRSPTSKQFATSRGQREVTMALHPASESSTVWG
jgi:hypothetical protein